MNCEEVRENLSLYAAGDIERPGARETVGAHLDGCDACRALAAEWEASRRLLQLHEPPEFDAAFFDSVRRGVMRQLNEGPRPSLLARLLGQPFGQRALTYAAVFSLLVCAAILSSHFLRRAPAPVVEVAEEDKGVPGTVRTDEIQKPGSRPQEGSTEKDEVVAPRPQTNPTRRREARQADVAVKRNARRGEKLATRPPTPNEEQFARTPGLHRHGVSFEIVPEAEGSANQVETVAAVNREVLRIELQTADPNIRIIWLSPRTTDSGSSNKTNR